MDTALQNVVNHLEFFGFEIVPRENENSVLARHAMHGSVFVKAYLGGVLLQQYFRVNENVTTDRAGFLEALNQLNSSAQLTTYVAGPTDDPHIRMDGLFLGMYDKKNFGAFLDAFLTDTGERVLRNEQIRKYIS
jgi:hypothetical protein